MAKLKLAEGGFSLMRAGKQTVVISKAEGKPSGKPTEIAVTFANEFGETLSNGYTLDSRNDKGFVVTSIFLKACLGSIEEFDTDEIKDLVGKYLEVEVKHVTLPNKNDETKEVTFANIGKIIGGTDAFDNEDDDEDAPVAPVRKPRL